MYGKPVLKDGSTVPASGALTDTSSGANSGKSVTLGPHCRAAGPAPVWKPSVGFTGVVDAPPEPHGSMSVLARAVPDRESVETMITPTAANASRTRREGAPSILTIDPSRAKSRRRLPWLRLPASRGA